MRIKQRAKPSSDGNTNTYNPSEKMIISSHETRLHETNVPDTVLHGSLCESQRGEIVFHSEHSPTLATDMSQNALQAHLGTTAHRRLREEHKHTRGGGGTGRKPAGKRFQQRNTEHLQTINGLNCILGIYYDPTTTSAWKIISAMSFYN